MLKIDPAEEDEEERLASAMRTYLPTQVTETPIPVDVVPPMQYPIMLQLYGQEVPMQPPPPGMSMGLPMGMSNMTPMGMSNMTPMKQSRPKTVKTPRSPRGDKSAKKKSHKKRRRKDSDESTDDEDCDPDFRAWVDVALTLLQHTYAKSAFSPRLKQEFMEQFILSFPPLKYSLFLCC